jgi:hypothetical protein
MAACPNCGRPTLRTKDWACQWCGYPLISRAYKPIDKTFKELQEERSLAASLPKNEDDEAPEESEFAAYDTEPEPEPPPRHKPEQKKKPEPPPQQPPKPKFRFFRKQEPTKPRPAPEPRQEPEYEDEDTVEEETRSAPPPPRPVYRPEPKPEPPPQRPAFTPPPAPAPLPRNEVLPQPVPKVEPPALPMQPVINIPPVAPQQTPPPVAQTPPPAPPPPAPEPVAAKPEIIVEPTAPYVPSVKAEDIREGMEISADDLDALFKSDKTGVNNKLNGKTIILKGVVEKVFIRDHLDIRYIMVTGKKRLSWSSRCTFNSEDSSKASRLNEGAEVMVRGKYEGYGKNVIFKDCQVI